MVSILALFCLATYLATFKKIGQFFPNRLVTLTTASITTLSIMALNTMTQHIFLMIVTLGMITNKIMLYVPFFSLVQNAAFL